MAADRTIDDINFEYSFNQAVEFNSKINAIKVYRQWKDVTYKEAAAYVVENWTALRAALPKGEREARYE